MLLIERYNLNSLVRNRNVYKTELVFSDIDLIRECRFFR